MYHSVLQCSSDIKRGCPTSPPGCRNTSCYFSYHDLLICRISGSCRTVSIWTANRRILTCSDVPPAGQAFLFGMLAGLVSYRAGSLARGLAGSLALAAAAFFQSILQILGI